jgi:hypothetical protein
VQQNRFLEEMQSSDKQEEYKKLCQLRGTIMQEVEEVNDLGETKLMAAAAEGRFLPSDFVLFPSLNPFCPARSLPFSFFCLKLIYRKIHLRALFVSFPDLSLSASFLPAARSTEEIKLLVLAGASVVRTRQDGVSAVWLAAQVPLTQSISWLVDR